MEKRITYMKKLHKAWMIVACLILGLGFLWNPEHVSAAKAIKAPYLAEQAIGSAPNLKVFITGSKMKSDVTVSGSIDDIKFKQNGDIVPFGDSDEGISYIYVLDNSGSVNSAQFDEVKAQLAKLRKKLGENDTLRIYTAGTHSKTGEKKNVLGRTVKGSETDAIDSDVKKIKNIELMGSDSQTVLYRSINEILASMDTPSRRTVLILVTDGEDESEGKDMNKTNTLDEVKDAIIPVYGILLNTKKQNPDKTKIEYTKDKILDEKNCRGFYYDCSESTSGSVVEKAFTKLDDIFNKQTYVVNLKTNTNKTVGAAVLKLKMGKNSNTTVKLNYSDYEVDENPPVIDGDVTYADKNAITFTISDEYGVNLSDAGDKSCYTLKSKTKKKKAKAKNWIIDSVKAEKNGNSVDVTLMTEETLYKGSYTLTVKGISDNSADANNMDETKDFTLKKGMNPILGKLLSILKNFWWLFLLLLLIIIGLIIIYIVKHKAVEVVEMEMDPDELNKSGTKMIGLKITDHTGMMRNLEWNVEGSLFIGRSNINNIYFDDDRLSKQHFVIEITRLGCYVQDLESTNGTYVNGVRISEKRLLSDGDIITGGREKFEYYVPKNVNID